MQVGARWTGFDEWATLHNKQRNDGQRVMRVAEFSRGCAIKTCVNLAIPSAKGAKIPKPSPTGWVCWKNARGLSRNTFCKLLKRCKLLDAGGRSNSAVQEPNSLTVFGERPEGTATS